MSKAWQLELRDLKRYPHFDKYLPIEKGQAIATNPASVASNAFFPFLRYVKSWRPYRPNDKTKKERPIRYASRRDAYIFARYRHLLAERYEVELERLGIQECPIAYRKIPLTGTAGPGKCNINFAKDAFDRIRAMGTCVVVALDISSYFESLDHDLLYSLWCRLVGATDLPADHNAVFRAITNYAVVDRDKAYERLGFIGLKNENGKTVRGYLRSYNAMPTQLCATQEFRQKIAGGDPNFPNLIEKNSKSFGIPQGAPISDILANIYLIDFDSLIASYAKSLGGVYFRYSDDILIIIPGDASAGLRARDHAIAEISKFGSEIKIKQSKTSVVTFRSDGAGSLSFDLAAGEQGKNGLEYLGFRFDGRQVYLRDSTLSGFYRKITYSLRHEVRAFVARYPGKDIEFMLANFNVEALISRFGRVEDFDTNSAYQDWTFWTYARRAAEEFGLAGEPIFRQIRNHRSLITTRLRVEFIESLSKSQH